MRSTGRPFGRTSEWIAAQAGVFTVHPKEDITWIKSLGVIRIPADSRSDVRRQPAGLGPSRATLFPDLDGSAANTNWILSDEPVLANQGLNPTAAEQKTEPATGEPRS
jgi:hypothetical protein